MSNLYDQGYKQYIWSAEYRAGKKGTMWPEGQPMGYINALLYAIIRDHYKGELEYTPVVRNLQPDEILVKQLSEPFTIGGYTLYSYCALDRMNNKPIINAGMEYMTYSAMAEYRWETREK